MARGVGIPDAKVELGTLGVQRESGGAAFHLPSLGPQPQEPGRRRAPQEGAAQPGLSAFQHRHLGLSHCQLRGFCRDRESQAARVCPTRASGKAGQPWRG